MYKVASHFILDTMFVCSLLRWAVLVCAVGLILTPLSFAQSLTFAPTTSGVPYGNPTALVTGDFNGDGLTDVAVVTGNYERMLVELSNGDGTYHQSADVTACMTIYCNPFSMVTADFNRDGKLDIAIVDQYTNALIVYLGNGDGTFQSPIAFPSNSNRPSTIVSADFNGDGIPDIAYTNNADNTVSVLLGNGDGTFGNQLNYPTGSSPTGLVAVDVNGDKSPDLAVANTGDNTVLVLLNNGSGQFQAGATLNVGTSPTDITAADFNADGKADLAVTNNGSANVSVALGNGDGTFQPPATFPVGQAPTGIQTADVNKDGAPDLVTINPADGTISILLGSGNGAFAPQQVFSANTGSGGNPYTPHRVVVGTFTRNGYTDIITTDTIFGQSPNIFTNLVQIAPTDSDSGQTSSTDNDTTLAQLTGGNSFSGNQSVNGSVTATSFAGSGSGLTGVSAASATTAYGLSCSGCVVNSMLATPSLTVNAGNGLIGGGIASLGGIISLGLDSTVARTYLPNTFTNVQIMPSLIIANNAIIGSSSLSTNAVAGTNGGPNAAISGNNTSSGVGVVGSSSVGVGVLGTGAEGVYGSSTSGTGVIGLTSGTNANTAAGVFVSEASTNAGNILLGLYKGTNEFVVDAKGDVTAAGSLTIGGGTSIVQYVSTTLAVTLPPITSGSCTSFTTSALTGFTPGTSDTTALGIPSNLLNLGTVFLDWQAWENSTSASPTITVRVCNPSQSRYSGGASGIIRVDLFKH